MANQINKLKALSISKLSKTGLYPDGRGLYLQVSRSGSKSWIYRYEKNKKQRNHGLGSFPTVTLEAARKEADFCRKLRLQGHDPIDYKNKLKIDNQLNEAKSITFKECALTYIEDKKSGWKNPKHTQQWYNTLETYAYPVIGHLPVQKVGLMLVREVLDPIWHTKTETASRVRSRMELVLSWAKVMGYRDGDNPAQWVGNLEVAYPKRSKVQKVKHMAAMPFVDVPAYFQSLRPVDTIRAKALAFGMLTATRSNEFREAEWREIDLEAGVWTIPPERMKKEKEHRVPLTDECIKILEEVKPLEDAGLVFPDLYNKDNTRKSVTEAAPLNLLQSTHPDLTVHGFRSSFRDWVGEVTNYASEVAEAALAHGLKDATQAAYERGTKFNKRKKLMDAWSDYCLNGNLKDNVIPINQKTESTGN